MSETRRFDEAFAITHVWEDGARVTGNAFAAGGRFGVILGDSYTAADQVADGGIAASVIERMARSEQVPLNVREYGWSGAGVPVYLGIAPKVLKSLDPAWVAIVLNATDLGRAGLRESSYWQGEVDTAGEIRLRESSDEQRIAAHGTLWRLTRALMTRSTLAFLAIKKAQEIVAPAAPDEQAGDLRSTPADDAATAAAVRALAHAYGPNLLLVYVPRIGLSPEFDRNIRERALLEACAAAGVRCVSMRQRMIRARDIEQVMCAGFGNTEPGTGHLNAYGHRVLAELIWSRVRDRHPR